MIADGRVMEERGRLIRDGAVALVLSMVFYSLGVVSFLYVVPVMLFALKGGRRKAELLLSVVSFIVLALEVFHMRGADAGKERFAYLLISLYFPLSLSAAGIVWLETEHDHRLLRRLVSALVPSIVFLFVITVFIYTDRALLDSLMGDYENALAQLMGDLLGQLLPGLEMSVLAELVLMTVLSMLVPFLLASICASCFIYCCGRHSRESEWEWSVMTFEYPPNVVWGLIVSWALVLLLHFVSVPAALIVAVMNLALSFCVLYGIEGFSVVMARLRRKNGKVRSMTVFTVLFIASIALPGINLIIILGLPLLGVLESFFDLKKIGAEYENHS